MTLRENILPNLYTHSKWELSKLKNSRPVFLSSNPGCRNFQLPENIYRTPNHPIYLLLLGRPVQTNQYPEMICFAGFLRRPVFLNDLADFWHYRQSRKLFLIWWEQPG